MDFFNFINNYPEEEREQFIKQLILQIQGKPTPPTTKRWTFVIDFTQTDDEIRATVANHLGVSIDKVPWVDIKNEVEKIRNSFTQLNEQIESYKAKLLNDPKTQPSKIEELTDVGRFLNSINEGYTLVFERHNSLYPDFVIRKNNVEIGIEHTRAVIPTIKEGNQHLHKYLTAITSNLQARFPLDNDIINIAFNFGAHIPNNPLAKSRQSKNEKESIIQSTTDYIVDLKKNRVSTKPNFIERVVFSKGSTQPITVGLIQEYLVIDDFRKIITERIQDKEQKYSKYVTSAMVSDCWLLIVIDGVNSYSGFNILEAKTLRIPKSPFSKIFVFEVFSGQAVILDQTND